MLHYSVYPDYETLSARAAELVVRQVQSKPSSVLGLATGSTPVGLYAQLVQHHLERRLSLADVTTFNLDEYLGIHEDHAQSYHVFMEEHLFRHVDVAADRVHFPGGELPGTQYERLIRRAGGIDLQILGIGANGHIGFNEPGSAFNSRTREVALAASTIEANARFFDDESEVPRRAVTMGIATIMEADCILLMASGANKAAAIADAFLKPPSVDTPASCLQLHSSVHVLLDEAASSKLP